MKKASESYFLVDPNKLKPHPRNYRSHPPEQLDHIEQSIRDHGFYRNVVVAQGDVILAGHGVVEAAKRMGRKEVPVIRLDLKPTSSAALKILAGDNEISRGAENDDAELARILKDVLGDGTLLGTGFDDASLNALLAKVDPQEAIEDEAPPLRKTDIKTGDIFALGGHRIMCGDSTMQATMDALMPLPHAAALLITDPPYGVAYQSNMKKQRFEAIANDDLDMDKLLVFLSAALNVSAAKMAPGSSAFVFHGDQKPGVRIAAETAFCSHFHMAATIVWVKKAATMGWQDYRSQYEPILYGWKDGDHARLEDRTETNVWSVDRDGPSTYVHPTQKPVEIFARAIRNHTKKGDKILEPFSGSGAQIIAAEQLGRRCFAMELDPQYVQVAIDRWEKFTNQKATKVS